jgi:uncharacterized membrane protein YdjX (TVP38/TMEM64 family)
MERRRWIRRVLTAAGAAIVLYLAWSIWDYQALMDWIARARPVPFFTAMALLPAFALPLTPFYLLAGATFDARVALGGTALALAANLTLCYFVGRSSLRPRLVSLFERFGYQLPDFDAEAGRSVRNTVRFTVLFKFAPGVPAFVKAYGLGAARVPFPIYFAVGLVASAIYAVPLLIAGDSLFSHQLDRRSLLVLVAIALAIAGYLWSRRQQPAPA